MVLAVITWVSRVYSEGWSVSAREGDGAAIDACRTVSQRCETFKPLQTHGRGARYTDAKADGRSLRHSLIGRLNGKTHRTGPGIQGPVDSSVEQVKCVGIVSGRASAGIEKESNAPVG